MTLAPAIVLATALALGASPPGDGQGSRLTATSGPLKVGGEMNHFAGWTLGGELWSSERLRKRQSGQALVVSFFATWCQPCVRSLPTLEKVRATTPEAELAVVLVAYGEDADAVAPFAERLKLGAPVLLDPYAKIAARFGVDTSLPRTFVIGPDGKVRAIFETEGSDFEEALRAEIKAAGPRGR